MAADNVSLGKFNLVGIPPAPRGVPQIEVTFDIDANGILHVSAKDLATGNEQKITITATTKLTEEEKERMIKEAEKFAEQDKKKKEEAELLNKADNMVYTANKTLKDLGDKVPEADKEKIKKISEELEKAISEKNIETVKKKTDELADVLQQVSTKVYQQAAQAHAQQQQAQQQTQDEKKKAKKAMFAAEGSDWNWWYGNEHQKATHFEFDNLYRRHLMSVYEINNKKPPDFLFDSIIRGEEMVIQIEPKWLVKPLIDGKDTDFFEWANGGLWRGEASDGTMIISEPIIELIKFGFDMENIYFLVKFSKTGLSFKNFSLKINLRGEHGINEDVIFSKKDGDWRLDSKIPVVWKFDRVLEVKIPFLDLGFVRGEKVSFVVLFYVEGNVLARVPQRGRIMFTLPDDYYQCKNWEV